MDDDDLYELYVSVSLRKQRGGQGDLSVTEHVTVKAKSFLEIAQILGRFHELSEELNKEQKEVNKNG